jgi:hydrogenase maturation protein HypF
VTIHRQKYSINGIVQGVGFRPYVYRLARECHLTGFVHNNSNGVHIEVEGSLEDLRQFSSRLPGEAPPRSHIVDMKITDMPTAGDEQFVIRPSDRRKSAATLISPDIATCDDCLKELFDPTDRRYLYPFINCTNCGPRFTIVNGIPYDRPLTSMHVFRMCPECEREYNDPGDRRFHAQPNACPACGPKVFLTDHKGQNIETDRSIADAVALLKEGKIIAVRGVGGFHLAVDPTNEPALLELRRRKGRAEKPFALMSPDMQAIRFFCEVSAEEEKLLWQPDRPIVLMKARPATRLSSFVAPRNNYLGFMLPYTPLHYLILKDHFDALVMTSGNFSEEPIAISNDEAVARLGGIADYFLLHDREILQRCDDSIVRLLGKPRIIRRARGYVPSPVFLKRPTSKRILACGGELKNTIALSRGETVFLSQHIGDLENAAAYDFFQHAIEHLEEILDITPQAVAHDLHPEYLSTKWAHEQIDLPRIAVQHHHAHQASVMAENGVEEETIGIILDGTGYGTDGTIWGGEVLVGDFAGFERMAWLQPTPLPGGDMAVRQPWRQAVAHLLNAFGSDFRQLDLPFFESVPPNSIEIIPRMIEQKINSPLSSGCGRLFDAVSALLNICTEISYEAQAAIELEMIADRSKREYDTDIVEQIPSQGVIPVDGLIRKIVSDALHGVAIAKIAAMFHYTLAEMFIKATRHAAEMSDIHRVALSGGVYQNVLFFEYMVSRLERLGFEVLTHSKVPTNDGGIALGQIVVADAQLSR